MEKKCNSLEKKKEFQFKNKTNIKMMSTIFIMTTPTVITAPNLNVPSVISLTYIVFHKWNARAHARTQSAALSLPPSLAVSEQVWTASNKGSCLISFATLKWYFFTNGLDFCIKTQNPPVCPRCPPYFWFLSKCFVHGSQLFSLVENARDDAECA